MGVLLCHRNNRVAQHLLHERIEAVAIDMTTSYALEIKLTSFSRYALRSFSRYALRSPRHYVMTKEKPRMSKASRFQAATPAMRLS